MGEDVRPMASVAGSEPERIALLANPAARAGRAAGDLDRVLDRLRTHGIDAELLVAPSRAAAQEAAHGAVSRGVDRLLVLGGDGIVHLGVQAVAGTGVALGVIASGTGNDFARALDLLAGTLEERVDRALLEPTPLDAIGTDAGFAATSVIAGFPATVNARANRMSFPRGTARYTVATLLELSGMRPTTYRLAFARCRPRRRAARRVHRGRRRPPRTAALLPEGADRTPRRAPEGDDAAGIGGGARRQRPGACRRRAVRRARPAPTMRDAGCAWRPPIGRRLTPLTRRRLAS